MLLTCAPAGRKVWRIFYPRAIDRSRKLGIYTARYTCRKYTFSWSLRVWSHVRRYLLRDYFFLWFAPPYNDTLSAKATRGSRTRSKNCRPSCVPPEVRRGGRHRPWRGARSAGRPEDKGRKSLGPLEKPRAALVLDTARRLRCADGRAAAASQLRPRMCVRARARLRRRDAHLQMLAGQRALPRENPHVRVLAAGRDGRRRHARRLPRGEPQLPVF